jgi:hypothetical protein
MPFGNYIIRSSRNQRGKEDLLFSSLQVLSSAHVKAKLLCPWVLQAVQSKELEKRCQMVSPCVLLWLNLRLKFTNEALFGLKSPSEWVDELPLLPACMFLLQKVVSKLSNCFNAVNGKWRLLGASSLMKMVFQARVFWWYADLEDLVF